MAEDEEEQKVTSKVKGAEVKQLDKMGSETGVSGVNEKDLSKILGSMSQPTKSAAPRP